MDVLITSDPEKIPPDIRQLEDSSQPLPADVQFFEEKFTLAGLVKSLILGIVLMAVGILVIAFFFYVVFSPRLTTVYSGPTSFDFAIGGVGLAFLIGGYLLFVSVRSEYRLMREQARGADTRYGIFLVKDLFVRHSSVDTTIIPRPFFKGLAGNAVRYEFKGEVKSFNLLAAFVGSDPLFVAEAIEKWAASSR
jgi:hypothetical protein